MTNISKLNFGVIIPKEIQDKINKLAEEQDLKEQQKILAELEKLRTEVVLLKEEKAILLDTNKALISSVDIYKSQIDLYKQNIAKSEELANNQKEITKIQEIKANTCNVELEKTRKDLISARKSGSIKNGIIVGLTTAAVVLGSK